MSETGTLRGVQGVYTRLSLLDQHSSGHTDEEISKIIAIVGRERLTSYLATTASEREALALYRINGELSKHFHEVIGGFEVALRNSISSSLTQRWKRSDWYKCRKLMMALQEQRRANVKEVRARLKHDRREERPGRIIAGLTFHFWVSLHEKRYRDIVWTPHLYKIWPEGTEINAVHKDLIKIRDLRNRIAHYEPIFQEKWHKHIDNIWKYFAHLSPENASWYQRRTAGQIASLRTVCRSIPPRV